jgi:5-methylcytosine-specific restriction endonuclease McrA
MIKKQQSKRLAKLGRDLIYLSEKRFLSGISVYAQAVDLAVKIVGASDYGSNPRSFIKQHMEALEQYVLANNKRLLELKKDGSVAKSRAPKMTSRQRKNARLAASGYFVISQTPPKPKAVNVAGVDVASDSFLATYEWRKLRMQALKKYGPKCMCCGATPATGAVMNVDHIKPRKLFPALAMDLSNLQVLCHECNHGKGNWDQTDWRVTS